jgi:hypothetical protein
MNPSASPEMALLVACLQARLDQADAGEKIRRIIESGIRWEEIDRLAVGHKIAPIVFHTFRNHAWSLTPAAFGGKLREAATGAAMRSLALWKELLRLLEALEHIGVEALPVKGPVLAATLDGSLSLREYDDLDLVVRPEHLLQARDLLLREGYFLVTFTHADTDSALWQSENRELLFGHKTRRSAVDLHWALLSRYLPFQLPVETVWKTALPRSIMGRKILTLAPRHELLYLCLHGAKHGWSRLCWIADVAQFVEKVPFEWASLIEEARRLDLELAAAHALLLARSLLNVTLPPAAAQWAEGVKQAPETAEWARRRLFAGGDFFSGAVESASFLFRFAAGPRARIRIIEGIFLRPTEAEWKLVRLPPNLYWLYYAVRPARLAVKFARAALGG